MAPVQFDTHHIRDYNAFKTAIKGNIVTDQSRTDEDFLPAHIEQINTRLKDIDNKVQALINHTFEALKHSNLSIKYAGELADRQMLLQGRIASRQLPYRKLIRDLGETEFRVFSQWGEDGIIEWLIAHVQPDNRRFVEFGTESFGEANCRFLLLNRSWKGLIMDGGEENMASVRREMLYWRQDLTAAQAFITAENINEHLRVNEFKGDLGLLSIDIDGNDYWVWERISVVNPAIIICEYNAILGDRLAVTTPYDATFTRFNAHHSGLFFGASIAALRHLATQRGYEFVGTNTNGVNAFFVRNDLADRVLPYIETCRAYPSRHRDSRDTTGELTFTGGVARFDLIKHLPVVEVTTGRTVPLQELGEPYSQEWLDEMA